MAVAPCPHDPLAHAFGKDACLSLEPKWLRVMMMMVVVMLMMLLIVMVTTTVAVTMTMVMI